MASELEELRRRLEAAEHRASCEERLREAAQKQEGQARQKLKEVERRRQEAERRQYKTSLPEFLHACHTYLYRSLTVQGNPSQATQGRPDNAANKVRPQRITPWHDFTSLQAAVWEPIMLADFSEEKHFMSSHTLEELGGQLRQRKLGSELDLHYFARAAVEDHVTAVINRMACDRTLQYGLQLEGSVTFENHANMLSSDDVARDLQNLATENMPRRSQRLQQKQKLSEIASPHPQSQAPTKTGSHHSRADAFCVYSRTEKPEGIVNRRPVLVLEFKAPHKLTLSHICAGLKEMDLDDIVQEHLEEDVQRRCQRLVAAVITQAFSYMIEAGLELGCIFTGQAIIFLRIPEDDPSTVYYSLAVPNEDVGSHTGWTTDLDEPNRLHLTAVGQLLAFTLRAIQLAPRDLQWRREARCLLKSWEVTLQDIEQTILEEEVPGSEYRPPLSMASSPPRSPISRRLRRPLILEDNSLVVRSHTPDASDDSEHGASRTPIRTSRGFQRSRGDSSKNSATQESSTRQTAPKHHRKTHELRPYCTSLCLRGLVEGGPLDLSCPNAKDHGTDRHVIGLKRFTQLLRNMLRNQADYCNELYVNGATGVLYHIRLPQWGYTVVAKGTTLSLKPRLLHEAKVYSYLRPLQGVYCPVYLCSVDVQQPFWYFGREIGHLMVMSFEGRSLCQRNCPNELRSQALQSMNAIHECGVLHRDIAPRNILYNPHQNRLMWHDFDRARIISSDRRAAEGPRRDFDRELDAVRFHIKCC